MSIKLHLANHLAVFADQGLCVARDPLPAGRCPHCPGRGRVQASLGSPSNLGLTVVHFTSLVHFFGVVRAYNQLGECIMEFDE